MHAVGGDRESNRSSHDAKEQALGKELPDESRPTGTERGANGDLALARRAAREQHVSDIGASEEQDESHRTEKDKQRGSNIADDEIS